MNTTVDSLLDPLCLLPFLVATVSLELPLSRFLQTENLTIPPEEKQTLERKMMTLFNTLNFQEKHKYRWEQGQVD